MPSDPETQADPGSGAADSAPDADAAAAAGPEPASVEPAEAGSPVEGTVPVAAAAPKAGAAPVVQGDWLASVCPYLTSEDGTYRSAAPDESHRCTAQDPAATLPLAFQERFCLTDRHPRCEMYKFAQETDASGGIPSNRVPPTDPPTPVTRGTGGRGPDRPLLATIIGIAGVVVVVLLVIVFLGSCGGDGDGQPQNDPDLVPAEQATEAPASTPAPTPDPTPEPDDPPSPDPDAEATPDEAAGETVYVLYEIQPDEALLRISETFGITRNRIRRENPELEGVASADLPGIVIQVPIVGDMTLTEAEALAGFVGVVGDEATDAGA